MNHENQLQAYLTLDPARNRIRIHRQTIRLLKNPAYVQFLVNPEELYIAVLGSDKPISGGTANKVRMSNTSQQSIEFYSTILIKNFSELLGGFDLRFNYQLTGEIASKCAMDFVRSMELIQEGIVRVSPATSASGS